MDFINLKIEHVILTAPTHFESSLVIVWLVLARGPSACQYELPIFVCDKNIESQNLEKGSCDPSHALLGINFLI